ASATTTGPSETLPSPPAKASKPSATTSPPACAPSSTISSTDRYSLPGVTMTDTTAKPSVLFVCVHNAGRSQMAAGFLRDIAGDRIEVRSAGSMPADQINPIAVDAMAELGIDITAEAPRSEERRVGTGR